MLKSGLYFIAVHYSEGGEEVNDGTEKASNKEKFELFRVKGRQIKVELVADTNDTAIIYGDNYVPLCGCSY